MNFSSIAQFNFTYAIPDGAWLKDDTGLMEWVPFSEIVKQLGQLWLDRQLRKQGWMTGCWIEVEK